MIAAAVACVLLATVAGVAVGNVALRIGRAVRGRGKGAK